MRRSPPRAPPYGRRLITPLKGHAHPNRLIKQPLVHNA